MFLQFMDSWYMKRNTSDLNFKLTMNYQMIQGCKIFTVRLGKLLRASTEAQSSILFPPEHVNFIKVKYKKDHWRALHWDTSITLLNWKNAFHTYQEAGNASSWRACCKHLLALSHSMKLGLMQKNLDKICVWSCSC